MKTQRVLVSRFGDPEVLQLVREERPTPAAWQVRVRVLAAGVSSVDLLMRRGLYATPRPPFAPGYDVVGEVDAVGADVPAGWLGQRVLGVTQFGGYAESLCVRPEVLVPVPADLDPVAGVCLGLNYLTAYQMLHRVAEVRPGQRILVYGAAGGVGSALLDLAHQAGVRCYAAASEAKLPQIERLHAVPIAADREDAAERVLREVGGVDAAFDPIGGRHLLRSASALAPRGRLVVFGLMDALSRRHIAPTAATTAALALLQGVRGRSVRPYNVLSMRQQHEDWYRADLASLIALLRAGRVRPEISAVLPLGEAARAHQILESRGHVGKIVLRCAA